MIKSLLFISIAPILICTLYVYVRDKYEKEPINILLKALLTGILIVLPILLIEKYLFLISDDFTGLSNAAFNAFIVAALTEEGLKYVSFVIIFWRNKNFNEQFDGIVYAVYISMGFAAIENILYVYQGGYNVGVLRAVTAVPAHALFGIVMGYHFGLARFYPQLKNKNLLFAFVLPFIWHGFYDFLLMSQNLIFLSIFIPLIIFYWITGFRKMEKLSKASLFRNDNLGKKERISTSDRA